LLQLPARNSADEAGILACRGPRETDSLCPKCLIRAREKIIADEAYYNILHSEKVDQIPASIIERDGKIWMIKECPEHGRIEDNIAIDSSPERCA
jgi:uncharacterized radical SAM superfamily Fe-S cluster-containing enzyme